MPFEKVETSQVDFPAMERGVLKFWVDKDIFEKRKARNSGKPKWSFLDGPITANNPMGVHHAWNRTYKDAYNRYFAMTGHELRYQQGFDCQGLWVEVEVEKELELKSKRDIENLVPGDRQASIDKFVQACISRVNRFARVQTEQSIRLGYWMNWDKTDADWAKDPDDRQSYFTMSTRNNTTIWSFLKKCHHKKMIYRGYDVMPWCGRCGVGISEQEMKEGYKLIEHRACFVKFPLRDRPGENLLAWTTTPWTLTSNVGAAVNPKLTYLQVKLKGEIYYLAKGVFKQDRMAGGTSEDDEPTTASKGKREWLKDVPHLSSLEQMFKSKAGKDGFEIVGEVKGEEMLGWAYHGPFDDLPAQQSAFGYPEEVAKIVEQNGWCPKITAAAAHRVVSGGDDVSESEGTGIVHTAPGCGGIDFTWGKEHGLPPVAPLEENGAFAEGFGPFVGKLAYDPATADLVFEELKKRDRLFTVERYVHRYPHCWRCKQELLYRLVDEWFINMGERNTENGFRGDIMKVVDQVTFLPESLNGRARERDWLWNMGDWMISKKRYWGLSLPIWVDEKDPTDFEVIGSLEELQERAIEGWDEFSGHTPHRPWIDKVVLRNPRTGNRMHRIPDVGNPWLDAGIVAFSTMPQSWYPADFITESFPGQFRNWFYALLALSTMMSDGQAPFKTLLGFATVQDQFGKPMHKSDGNSIEFIGAADDGFELFFNADPKADVKQTIAKELPKGFVSQREEMVTVKGEEKRKLIAKYKPIGADVIRWLYCRQSPAQNLNFGPEPTDDVRGKFVLKLWNCYALFCNYAKLDGFDPKAAPVRLELRPKIDQWILSDLQTLIGTARESFEKYDIMRFAVACEEFIDAKLSNWYIRVNRDRFWSKNAELDEAGLRDKLAAYQTLYTVLKTVSQLIAPCVPFLAETMWQNLRTGDDEESVHLTSYPVPEAAKQNPQLSADMDAVLRIVGLGHAARNVAKIKVRQPVAELVISSTTEADARAVTDFADLITGELNVKAVRLHAASTPLLTASVKFNKKTAASKLGAKLKEAESILAETDALALQAQARNASVTIADVELQAADFTFEFTAEAGFVGVVEKGTQAALDTRITPELKAEGLAREVVRFVQDARKEAGLNVSDKIALTLTTDNAELTAAIDTHRTTIAGEVQATTWTTTPMAAAFTTEVTVDGAKLTIALSKD
ncbi:MAG: class I tRNA ligase family protein [Fimbriiglobus sp.]